MLRASLPECTYTLVFVLSVAEFGQHCSCSFQRRTSAPAPLANTNQPALTSSTVSTVYVCPDGKAKSVRSVRLSLHPLATFAPR